MAGAEKLADKGATETPPDLTSLDSADETVPDDKATGSNDKASSANAEKRTKCSNNLFGNDDNDVTPPRKRHKADADEQSDDDSDDSDST